MLVPLCGKSKDMLWLAAAWPQHTRQKLSETAVREFFEEFGVTPEISQRALSKVTRWKI